MAWTTITNIKGPKGDPGDQGPPGQDGKGIAIAGQVDTYGDLPTDLTADDAGKGYIVNSDGLLYVWSGSAFPDDGQGVAFVGPAGTITIGTVVSLPTGATPTVTNSGSESAATLNFGLPAGPRGPSGATGTSATVDVDPATVTGAPGSSAAVTNTGTDTAAMFRFTIPAGAAGATGAKGDKGATGTRGSKWFAGPLDGNGAPPDQEGQLPGDFFLDTNSGNVWQL